MSLYFISVFFYSILLQCFTDVVTESVDPSNSSCIQAVATPKYKSSCVPLQYNSYCKKNGVLLDHFVFETNNTQMENDRKLIRFQNELNYLNSLGFTLFYKKCKKAIDIVYCHYYFPKCDGTADSYKAQKLCKETCQYFRDACNLVIDILNSYALDEHDIIECENFPWRNAGESPECYYFDERPDEKNCVNGNDRSSEGNISVTSSGILCQSWTAQCPHRHTMTSTYPALKNASNYCRNPRGSGQRPWCFTSDPNKRWEYCNITSCLSNKRHHVRTVPVMPTINTTPVETVPPKKFTTRITALPPTINITTNSSCVPAVATPSLVNTPCAPLQYDSYCRNKGIHLAHLVFESKNTEKENENKLKQFQSELNLLKLFGVSIHEKCRKALDIVFCQDYFPRCDSTTDSYKAQTLCKETCHYFNNACSDELEKLKNNSLDYLLHRYTDCNQYPWRNAGKSPECYYFDQRDDEKGSLNPERIRYKKECMQENAGGYQGNISVTSSGIPCQSWTAQCPHRHTMTSTYPELKNASNYCRNARGSGQRPWCFTSDKNKRWEYCDIPSCHLSVVTATQTVSLHPTNTAAIKTVQATKFAKSTTISSKITNGTSTARIIASNTASSTITTTSAMRPTKITPTFYTTNSPCSPAEPSPSVQSPCTRLDESFGAYCKKHGVKLDSYVFKNKKDQSYGSKKLNKIENIIQNIMLLSDKKVASEKCLRIIRAEYCHHYFPTCDRTGSQTSEQKRCKATCDFVRKTCKKEVKIAEKLSPRVWKDMNCTNYPTRDAGSSPECWYYDGNNTSIETHSRKDFNNDCLYLDGRGYQGNIAVTLSGIPCQSWTAQCPHRHTMTSTYPELKNASNHCRNARGSGQRPWCFTSDKNRRWEYCNIPHCLPVNGGYGNWTLSSRCNSSCGEGIEGWRRLCDSPTPRYGGNNCSSLGNAAEYRNCSNSPPCPVNGNYGNWVINSTCNVSCGDGFKMWIRTCDNPTPANGGNDCLVFGESKKWKPCRMVPCLQNRHIVTNTLKIAIGAGVASVVLAVLIVFGILIYRRMNREYATIDYSMEPVDNTEDPTEPDIDSVRPPTGYETLQENTETLSHKLI